MSPLRRTLVYVWWVSATRSFQVRLPAAAKQHTLSQRGQACLQKHEERSSLCPDRMMVYSDCSESRRRVAKIIRPREVYVALENKLVLLRGKVLLSGRAMHMELSSL